MICRTIASITTIASSVRSPTERDKARVVIKLREKPIALTKKKVPITEVGRETAIIIAALLFIRKSKTMNIARNAPIKISKIEPDTAPSVKGVVSPITSTE